MVRRFNRLLVVLYLLADAGLGMVAFALAYFLRFHGPIAQLIPPVKGIPPFKWYVYMLPFVAVLVPVAFHMQGLYRLRRGRTRLDDFFAVFVGSILAVVLGVFGTLVVGTYYLPEHLKDAGVSDYSIHLDEETNFLFGVLWRRTDHGMADLPNHPVMKRWWAHMADIMETKPDNEPLAVPLETMFRME